VVVAVAICAVVDASDGGVASGTIDGAASMMTSRVLVFPSFSVSSILTRTAADRKLRGELTFLLNLFAGPIDADASHKQ